MSLKKKKIIIANWKMNPATIEEARGLFSYIKKTARSRKNIQTVICPPFVYLHALEKFSRRSTIFLGAQDIFWQDSGAFTGEISAGMIKNTGGCFVIVGHSERRTLGETDEIVNKKIVAAVQGGLTAVVCFGEKERDHEGRYFHFLKEQISHSLKDIQKKYLRDLIIAYEPIFAIGKSDEDALKPEDVHEMAIFFRKNLIDHFKTLSAASIPIVYGGSVSAQTAGNLIVKGAIDGLLVGHQSLDRKNFGELLGTVNGLQL